MVHPSKAHCERLNTVGAGIYWANAAEMWVDVVPDTAGTKTHWFAESGIVDVYLMSGAVV